jgi:hypothetical protein
MMSRWMTGWQTALRGIALALAVTHGAAAQSGASDAGEEGECMPGGQPSECADRCPSFDTCYIAEGDGQLYYRVDDQRFDCDGLECRGASATLGDYCCRRGQFAPSRGGGGGCALPRDQPGPVPAMGHGGWSWLVALGLALAGRMALPRPRERRHSGDALRRRMAAAVFHD